MNCVEKTKIKKKRPGKAHLKKKKISYLCRNAGVLWIQQCTTPSLDEPLIGFIVSDWNANETRFELKATHYRENRLTTVPRPILGSSWSPFLKLIISTIIYKYLLKIGHCWLLFSFFIIFIFLTVTVNYCSL